MRIQHPAQPIVQQQIIKYTQSHCVLLLVHLSLASCWCILASWCAFSILHCQWSNNKSLSIYTQSHCVLLVVHLSCFILASWWPFSLGITYKKTIVINEMDTIENSLTPILLQAEKQLVLQPSIPNCHDATAIATLPNSYSLAWACLQTKSCSSNNQFEHDKAIHKYLNKKQPLMAFRLQKLRVG